MVRKYMSSAAWDDNWSIKNPIFKTMLDLTSKYYLRQISEIFKKHQVGGEAILELGCGTAEDTIWMINNFGFKKGTVVDFSDEALKRVLKNRNGLNIELVKKDILSLNLTEKYDLVHSGFVVEHFYGVDREKIIKKHAEFVKKGGFVFIQAPAMTILSWLYSKTINKLNGIDELLYTKGELMELLAKTNLKILEFKPLLGDSVFFILARKE